MPDCPVVGGANHASAEALLPSLASLALPGARGFNVGASLNLLGGEQRIASAVPHFVAAQGSTVTEHPENSDAAIAPGTPPLHSQSDLDALIAREYAGLRLLLQRRTHDVDLASDLLNEAICIAWEKWRAGHIAHPEAIAGYVYQVALNLLRNWRRSAGERTDRRAPQSALEILASAPQHEPLEQEMVRKVLRIVGSITPLRDRAVIVRFYLEEEDRHSICSDLKLSPDQFTKILHRARHRLRDLLEARGVHGRDLFSVLLIAV